MTKQPIRPELSEPQICSLIFLIRDNFNRGEPTTMEGEPEILLAMKKRGFGSGRYNGIGGKMDRSEIIEQTLVRETQEEIGVTPLSWEKVAVHDFAMDVHAAEPWHMIVHTYICRDWEGEPTETEEMAPEWFTLSKIPYDRMWDDDIFWLPVVLAGRKLLTSFSFDVEDHVVSTKMTIVSSFTDTNPDSKPPS